MTGHFKAIAGFMIFTGLLGLTACNTSNQDAANGTPTNAPTITTTVTTVPNSNVSEPEANSTAAPTKVANTSSTQNVSKEIKVLLNIAKKGKVPNVTFAAHTGLIDDVEKVWGKADKLDIVSGNQYATYTAKKVVFGFNKGSQIFDVRSSSPQLQKLTLKQIEAALGKPDDVKVNKNDKIYIYKANNQFQLKFIIPSSTGKVDHISVFSEKDSINNMAG
ncbi:hypothetical protein J2T20_005296 [Paenibacillus wynnii]|nr:YjgB family protein [Paenibacillus wynnii]MDQ0196876.1 hypothetical protein [Paenibacillus wynnii]